VLLGSRVGRESLHARNSTVALRSVGSIETRGSSQNGNGTRCGLRDEQRDEVHHSRPNGGAPQQAEGDEDVVTRALRGLGRRIHNAYRPFDRHRRPTGLGRGGRLTALSLSFRSFLHLPDGPVRTIGRVQQRSILACRSRASRVAHASSQVRGVCARFLSWCLTPFRTAATCRETQEPG